MTIPDPTAINPATGRMFGLDPPPAPASAPAPAATGSPPAADGALHVRGSTLDDLVKPDVLEAAQSAADAGEQAKADALSAAPTDPTQYKLPALPFGVAPPNAEQITMLREAASTVGLTAGEYRTLGTILAAGDHLAERGALDQRVRTKLADRMGADLEARYGAEGAGARAKYAVDAIATACKRPELAGLHDRLRVAILTNRPLLELLANIGERAAKQKR